MSKTVFPAWLVQFCVACMVSSARAMRDDDDCFF